MKEGCKRDLVISLQLVDLPDKLIGELSSMKVHLRSYEFTRFDSSIAFCEAMHSARRRYNSCSRGGMALGSSASSGCEGWGGPSSTGVDVDAGSAWWESLETVLSPSALASVSASGIRETTSSGDSWAFDGF